LYKNKMAWELENEKKWGDLPKGKKKKAGRGTN
jgi:hypothetical protein